MANTNGSRSEFPALSNCFFLFFSLGSDGGTLLVSPPTFLRQAARVTTRETEESCRDARSGATTADLHGKKQPPTEPRILFLGGPANQTQLLLSRDPPG